MGMGVDQSGGDQFTGCINGVIHRTIIGAAHMANRIVFIDDETIAQMPMLVTIINDDMGSVNCCRCHGDAPLFSQDLKACTDHALNTVYGWTSTLKWRVALVTVAL